MDEQSNHDQEQNKVVKKGASSTGLDDQLAGLLCYLAGFITGIIFLILEKESRFVRFHAMQSTITFIALFIVNMVLTAIPFIGWLIGIVLWPLTLIVWVVLMVKAYQREWFKLPVIGDIVEKQLK